MPSRKRGKHKRHADQRAATRKRKAHGKPPHARRGPRGRRGKMYNRQSN
ncbi:MAG: hypothetical protein MPI95_03575 [Nitrosopumilus sp.]|nr:hypothetical protein [Nitrosopumilus sp.]CAI9831856.1 conserved hypothetical protein [Nitrosopumilaceae archaeon]MDA7941642.1 hypothetical protein [Nitrosopumilus sp.]MDA7943783.1 hypothetical protein [Nitrosopumilus sp.]MDA7945147.1 hypothetical protein [Nitrosopumilus sp.]